MRLRFYWLTVVCILLASVTALVIPCSVSAQTSPVISSLSPDNVTAGSPDFLLTITGTNFDSSNMVMFGGDILFPISVTATKIQVIIPGSDLENGGYWDVFILDSSWNPISDPVTFTINNPVPTITSLSPNFAVVGSDDVTVTISGTGFNDETLVNFGYDTFFPDTVTATSMTVTVPAYDLASPDILSVSAVNPAPGGGTSNSLNFTVAYLLPTTTSMSPQSAISGGAAFTLTVTGTNFMPSSVVNWNGTALPTTYVSATKLTAAVPASNIARVGTANITITNLSPGSGTSTPALVFAINNPTPTTLSLSPPSALVGGPTFALVVTGTGFVVGSTINWNGTPLATVYGSSTKLSASIAAAKIATVGAASITVTNPSPGGGTSTPALSFAITNPVPTATSLTPNTVLYGSPAFVLQVTGTNFIAISQIKWNGTSLATTYVSSTQLTATIDAAKIASPSTNTVTVVTPSPGGGTTIGLPFTVVNPPKPTITSLNPASVLVGTGNTILTVSGTNFSTGAVVTWNGSALANTSDAQTATLLKVTIPASLLATAGTAQIVVVNPAPGLSSAAATFTVQNPVPTIASLSPALVMAGTAATTVTVTGTQFISSSVVRWNGNALTTTYVSSTQLKVVIPATNLATAGTTNVTVANPSPGGGVSNASVFTVQNPLPTNTALSPNQTLAGSPATTITVTGTQFVAGSTVRWNGVSITTTYVSSTQVQAIVPISYLTGAGVASVTVSNSSPGGGTSSIVAFTVLNPVPTIVSLSPAQAVAGSAATTITVTGTQFMPNANIRWNGNGLATTYVSSTQLKAVIPAYSLATAATANVTVTNPTPGGGASNAATFTIQAGQGSGVGVLTLTPSTANAGDASFTLTINGSNFLTGSVVSWNTSILTPTIVSPSRMTVVVPAAWIAKAGIAKIKVTTTQSVSDPVTFTIKDLGSFGEGLKMISVPYDYPYVNTLTNILGWINTSSGSEASLTSPIPMMYWYGAGNAYMTPAVTDGMRVGLGYWVRITAHSDTDGSAQRLALVTKGTPAATNQPYRLALSKGWNLIGDPFTVSVPLSTLGVVYSGTDTTVHTIAAASSVISPTVYTYDSSVSSVYQTTTVTTPSSALLPLHGYWVRALAPCILVITHP